MNTATVTTTAAIQQQSVASGVFKDVGLFFAGLSVKLPAESPTKKRLWNGS